MRALDSFAGVGWHIGARALGIEEEGIEIMPEAVATRDAIGAKTVHDDAWTYDYRPGSHEGKIDSPPCQTFSAAGSGAGRKALNDVLSIIRSGAWRDLEQLRAAGASLGEDERTALVLMPLHAWHIIRPEWVAWEQVPTVQPVWDACAELMREAGYSVWTGRLQAEQYGVPQTRKRSILIASKCHVVGMPKPTHSRYHPRSKDKLDPGTLKWVSMAEALTAAGLAVPGDAVRSNYGSGGDPANRGIREVNEPSATVTSKIDRNRWIEYVDGNQANSARRRLDDPAPTVHFGERMNLVTWQGRNSGPGAAREPRSIHDPSYTIRAQGSGSHPSGTEWLDTERKPVRVTVQEAAILQSFPADMPWQGSSTKQYLQVGNAVPPGLAIPVLGEAAGIEWQDINEEYRKGVFGR